jgi:hypothetical protein
LNVTQGRYAFHFTLLIFFPKSRHKSRAARAWPVPGLALFELFGKQANVAALLSNNLIEHIYAIGRAKDAAIFYQGLKDFARDPASVDVLDKIIREESHHIRLLTEEFKQR